jgi:hypothetical protein
VVTFNSTNFMQTFVNIQQLYKHLTSKVVQYILQIQLDEICDLCHHHMIDYNKTYFHAIFDLLIDSTLWDTCSQTIKLNVKCR